LHLEDWASGYRLERDLLPGGTAFLVAEDDSVGAVEEFLRVSFEVFGCRIEDHPIEIGLDEFPDIGEYKGFCTSPMTDADFQ